MAFSPRPPPPPGTRWVVRSSLRREGEHPGIADAIALIARTPGYEAVAADLTDRVARGRIVLSPSLPDRGQATLNGTILLGPEALAGGLLGLAETLVHEQFHTRQNPLLKTASFWAGVATGSPVMRRYERPAYRAALEFLNAVARNFPDLADEAHAEAIAVAGTFAASYGEAL